MANTNKTKTGVIPVSSPLTPTGADGDNQVGGVVAYSGDIYDVNQSKNQEEINSDVNTKLKKAVQDVKAVANDTQGTKLYHNTMNDESTYEVVKETVGSTIKDLDVARTEELGTLSTLKTTEKSSAVGAINENYDTIQTTFDNVEEVIPSVAKEGYYVDASNNQYSPYTLDDVAQSISVTLWNSATSPQVVKNIPVYKKGSGNGTHTYLETMGIKMVATSLAFTGDEYDVYWYSNPGNFAIQVNGSTVYLYPQGVVLKDTTRNITLTGDDSWYICNKYIYDLGGYVNFYWKGDATSSTKIILAKELNYDTQTKVTPVVEDRGVQHKFTKVNDTTVTLATPLAKVSDTGILADTEVSGATSIANAVNIVNKKVPTEYVKNTNLVDAGAGLNVFYNTDKTAKFTSYGSRPVYYEFYGMDNPVLYDCHFYQSSIEVEGYSKGWVKNPTQMYMSEGIVASNGSYIITEVSADYTTIKCKESSGTTEYTYNKYSDYDLKGDYKLLSSYNLYCYKAEDASAPYQYVYAYTETPSPGTSGTDHRVLTCIADWGMSTRVAVTEEERIIGKKLSVEDETSTTVDDAVLVVQGVVGDVRKLTTTADNLVDAINEVAGATPEIGNYVKKVETIAHSSGYYKDADGNVYKPFMVDGVQATITIAQGADKDPHTFKVFSKNDETIGAWVDKYDDEGVLSGLGSELTVNGSMVTISEVGTDTITVNSVVYTRYSAYDAQDASKNIIPTKSTLPQYAYKAADNNVVYVSDATPSTESNAWLAGDGWSFTLSNPVTTDTSGVQIKSTKKDDTTELDSTILATLDDIPAVDTSVLKKVELIDDSSSEGVLIKSTKKDSSTEVTTEALTKQASIGALASLITTDKSNVVNALNEIFSKFKGVDVYTQNTEPTANVGDIWFKLNTDSSAIEAIKVKQESSWLDVSLGSGNSTYISATEPTSASTGDMWVIE